MHLSLLTLPRRAGRWRFITSYQLHQVLWKAFPELRRGEQENRFLYRHDEHDDCHSILVQSVLQPNWSHVEDEAEGTTARIRTFDPTRIDTNTEFRFQLRANPVVQRKGYADGKSRRIVVGSKMDRVAERLGLGKENVPSREEKQIEWMMERGKSGGFEFGVRNNLPTCVPGPNRDYVIYRASTDQKPMTFTGVDFTGILLVTNAAAFADTLRHGIGRGKAFGFGLLSIARISG